MGVETGLLLVAGATALAGIGSATVGAINNEKSLSAQRDMYEKQRSDQLSDYANRTGIKSQLEQYSQMGINPAAAVGQVSGGSMPSVPSAPEIPQLENWGSTLGQGITQTMNALSKIKGFQKQDAEVQNLLSQQRLTDLQASYQQGQNFLQQAYGESEKAVGLRKMYADTMLAYAEGRYKDSFVSLNNMIEKLKGEEFKHMQTENSQFGLILAKQLQLISAQLDSERAKPSLMRSEIAANYGAAKQSHALAVESATRNVGLEFDNSIKKIDSENAAALAQAKLSALREQFMRDAAVSAEERVKAYAEFEKLDKLLKAYREHPNKAALDAAMDNFNEHFPILGGFFKALSK